MCCKALGLAKSTYQHRKTTTAPQRRKERDEQLAETLIEIFEEHGSYGYRPLVRELRDEPYSMVVNHKRLKRVLNEYDLALHRAVAANPPSAARVLIRENPGKVDLVTGREFGVLEVLSTDFTELNYQGGKAWMMVLVDITSKWVPGWAVGPSANTELALECWEMAKPNLLRSRDDLTGLIIHSDMDSVYTGYRWLDELMLHHAVRPSFSENGCKDNPWIESFWSRTKNDWHSRILEAATLAELRVVMEQWIDYYNNRRRHSSIDYLSPITFLTQQMG